MIFLVAAAILGMGGIVAYLAFEKGRSPILWAFYGIVAAPIALPQILMARTRADTDETQTNIPHPKRTQSVNDLADKMKRQEPDWLNVGPSRRTEPLPKLEDWYRQDLDAAGMQQPQTTEQPNQNMFADKNNARTQPLRAEPSFGAASAPASRAEASEFVIGPGDRIGARSAGPQASASGDHRSRAPLSVDPNTPRTDRRSFGGPLIAGVAVLAALVIAVFVLGPTLTSYIPAGLPFSTAPEVKNVATPGLTAPAPTASAAPTSGAPVPATASSGSAFGDQPAQTGPQDIGAAKLATPIPTKQDAKAPAVAAPSSATETNLALATRGMKPVDVPDEPAAKSEPAPEPAKAKSTPQPKPVATAPAQVKAAPKAETPKAITKAEPAAPAPKAPAAAKAQPEDFLSMVNKAIGPNGSAPAKPTTSSSTATASATPALEQVSESNDLVLSVQKKLRERGYDPGTIDGRTGPQTVQAIRDYQQSVGLPADGLIDVTLMERLGVVGKRLQFPTR